MMIFADTSGLFALLVKNDVMHVRAKLNFAYFAQHRVQLLTSSFVLVKAITGLTVVGVLTFTVVLRRRARPAISEDSLDEITAARLRWAARRVARMAVGRFQLSTTIQTTGDGNSPSLGFAGGL